MMERIRLAGRLDTNGHLTLRPTFPTAIPPERWRQETLAYVVEVLDATGSSARARTAVGVGHLRQQQHRAARIGRPARWRRTS